MILKNERRIMTSKWDQGLLNLTIDNAKIHAGSLLELWKEVSITYALRSVLVVSNTTVDKSPFHYEAENYKVGDLYNIIAAAYNLAWTQDRETGVAWFYPIEVNYSDILSIKIEVARHYLGLPMQSGILEILAVNCPDITVKKWDTLFRNTFDYAVDIPSGSYTIRDILNVCCVANSTKTFFLDIRNNNTNVTAINLVSEGAYSPPAGALYLWQTEIENSNGNVIPTRKQLLVALSDKEFKTRRASRNYLESIIWSFELDDLVSHWFSIDQALWTCIGITSIIVRTEDATHQASIEIMKKLATDDFLNHCEIGLALIIALEITRLTSDGDAIKVIKERIPGMDELGEVISDACRIVAQSSYVREIIQKENINSLNKEPTVLTKILQLANAGKLEFKL
jgi:hypothetical protein